MEELEALYGSLGERTEGAGDEAFGVYVRESGEEGLETGDFFSPAAYVESESESR